METVVLRTFDNYFSANITLSRLQDAGVSCFLSDEHASTIYPVFNNAGGIKLNVSERDEVLARQLLSEFDAEQVSAAVCPVCHHQKFSQHIRAAKTAVNAPLFIAITDFITKALHKIFRTGEVETEVVYVCGYCKYETKSLPSPAIEEDINT